MDAKVAEILNYDKQLEADLRALTGAFYTPLAIASDMVTEAARYYLLNLGYDENDVVTFLEGTLSAALSAELLLKLTTARLLDMACGTGVFAFAWLLKIVEWQRDFQLEDQPKMLVRAMSNMTLNDINQQSVRQFETLVKQYFKLPFSGLLLSCDALLELPEIEQIKKLRASGGFDIIIGNPPYVGERGNRPLFAPLKKHPKWARYYRGKMDYSYFFIHQALDFLAPQGVITQIMTSYFMTADGAAALRDDLRKRASWLSIHYFDKLPLFREVKNLSFMILTLSNKKQPQPACHVMRNKTEFKVAADKLYGSNGLMQLIPPADLAKLELVESRSHFCLADVLFVNQGLVSGADRLKPHHSQILGQAINEEAPIFVFEAGEYEAQDALKPFIKNSEITPYYLTNLPKRRILYSTADHLADKPKWLDHLAPYQTLLAARREVRNGVRAWYELQWPRDEQIFLSPKIIVPQRAKNNCFCYVETPLYGSADVYFLTLKRNMLTFNRSADIVLKALTMY